MSIRAVYFDLLDTLLVIDPKIHKDFPSLKKLYSYMTTRGVKVSYDEFRTNYMKVHEELYKEINETLHEPHFSLRLAKVMRLLKLQPDKSTELEGALVWGEEFMKHTTLEKDAPEVLRHLHEKFKLGLILNFSVPEVIYKILDQHGLSEFFDSITISGELNRRKPSREIFQKALNNLSIKPEEAIYVTDKKADCEAAKSVGMRSILLDRTRSNMGKPELETIAQLTEITKHIEN